MSESHNQRKKDCLPENTSSPGTPLPEMLAPSTPPSSSWGPGWACWPLASPALASPGLGVPSVSSFLSPATCFLYPGCFPESVFVLCVTDTQPESPRSCREVFWFPTTFLVAGRSSDQLRAWALSSRSFSFPFSHFLTKNGLCITVLVASLIGMARRGRCSRGTRPPPPSTL